MTADWRRALDIYVSGRNRALTIDEKRSAVGAKPSDAGSKSGSESTTTDSSSIEVSVPQTLEYFRNAGTWRDRIDGSQQHKAGPGA